jgi:hypothetical protein
MKLPAFLLLCGVLLTFNACERHPASALASLEAEGHGHEAAAEHKSAEAAKPAHKEETGPAPKFFPGGK